MKPISLLALLASLGFGSAALQQTLVKPKDTPAGTTATSQSTSQASTVAATPSDPGLDSPALSTGTISGGPTYVIGSPEYIVYEEWRRRHAVVVEVPAYRSALERRERFAQQHAAYNNPLNQTSNAAGVRQRTGTTSTTVTVQRQTQPRPIVNSAPAARTVIGGGLR